MAGGLDLPDDKAGRLVGLEDVHERRIEFDPLEPVPDPRSMHIERVLPGFWGLGCSRTGVTTPA